MTRVGLQGLYIRVLDQKCQILFRKSTLCYNIYIVQFVLEGLMLMFFGKVLLHLLALTFGISFGLLVSNLNISFRTSGIIATTSVVFFIYMSTCILINFTCDLCHKPRRTINNVIQYIYRCDKDYL